MDKPQVATAWIDAVLQSERDAVMAIDAGERVARSNAAAAALTGWSAAEAAGSQLASVCPVVGARGDAALQAAIRTAADTGSSVPLPAGCVLTRRDGSVRPITGTVIPAAAGPDTVAVAVLAAVEPDGAAGTLVGGVACREVVDRANEGVWVADRDFRTTYANAALGAMLGIAPEELIGRPGADFTHPDDADSVAESHHRRRDGVPETFERRLVRADGGIVWAALAITPRHTASGEFDGVFALLTDITRQKQAEAQAHAGEELAAGLFHHAPIGMFELDASTYRDRLEAVRAAGAPHIGAHLAAHPAEMRAIAAALRVPRMNARCARLLGAPDTDRLIANLVERATDASLAVLAEQSALLLEGRRHLTFELELRATPDAARVFSVDVRPCPGHPGSADHLLVAFTDITERQRTEAALHASEASLRSYLDGVAARVAVIDETGVIVAVNRPWRDYALACGTQAATCEGASYLRACETARGDDAEEARRIARGLRTVIAGECAAYEAEYACMTPNGLEWYLLRAARIQVARTCRVVISHMDITRIRSAEIEVSDRESELAAIYENAPIAMMVVDRNSRVRKLNRYASELVPEGLGGAMQQLLGAVISCTGFILDPECTSPQCRDCGLRRIVCDTIDTGRSHHDAEVTLPVASHGQTRLATFIASATRLETSGEPLALVSLIDVTERREADSRLGLQAMVLDQIADAVIVTDLQGGITYVNEAGARVVQAPGDTLVGRSVAAFGDDPARGATQEQIIDETLAHGNWEGIVANRAADGSVALMNVRTTLVHDHDGCPVAMCGVATDVSERLAREDQLKMQAMVLDQISDTVVVTDLEGNITYANQATHRATGLEPVGRSVEAFGYDARRGATPEEVVARTAADGHWRGEVVNYLPNGAEILVDLRTSLVRDASGQPIAMCGISTDVTDERRTRREREATLRLLHLLNERRDTHALLQGVGELLREWTGCATAGARVHEGPGFAQIVVGGEHPLFVRLEQSACAGEAGASGPGSRDGDPNRCLCTSVLRGTIDPSLPCTTSRGSFWTNDFGAATSADGDDAAAYPVLPMCPGSGAGSVALIPLKHGAETLGLLHLADTEQGRFTAELVAFLEQVADQVAVALAHKRSEEALAASESRLSLAMRAGRIGIWDWDVEAEWVQSHGLHERMFGLAHAPGGRPEADMLICLHADDTGAVRTALRTAVQTGAAFDLEFRVVWPDGTLHWIAAIAEPVRDQNGKITRVVGIVHEVTERKLAEEALRLSEARLNEAQAATHLGSFHWTLDGERVWLSAQAARMLGAGAESGVYPDSAVFDLIPMEDIAHLDAGVHSLRHPGETSAADVRMQMSDGIRLCHLVATLIQSGPDGLPSEMSGTIQDVTEQRALEAQLRQAQKMETVGRLAGGIAHDFNNMLQVIIGHAEISLMRDSLDYVLRDNLEQIMAAAERSAELTRRLLAFARQQTVKPETVDLNALVGRMQKMLARLVGEDISFEWKPAAELWSVSIDPSQLDQVLANLVVNARDAIEHTGMIQVETANVTCEAAFCAAHGGTEPGDYVLLSVADTGIGMDETTRNRMFDPFFTTKSMDKGTGLGLAMVYGIASQGGGFIDVQSAPGAGTEVRMYLPRAHGAPGPTAPRASSEDLPGGTETVLIVEDEDTILQLAASVLRERGYTVLATSSPTEALQMVDDPGSAVDLLLTDVVMSGLNGRELRDRARLLRPGLRCLFMSGYTANIIARSGVLDEGTDFLPKPFSVATLAHRVRTALDT